MDTVKELMDFLSGFDPDTKIVINDWDCYNDEPYQRPFTDNPYVEEKKKGKKHYKIIHF